MKRISMLFWICVSCISAYAQIEINNTQLAGTKWEEVEPVVRNINSYIQFTETCITDSIYYSTLEKSYSGSKEYYITNEIPSYSVFYKNLVGQDRKGRYIVVYNPKVNEVDYYTIVSFTDDELVLFHKAKPETIPGIDVYIKCKRIKW
jgi:hypothetical protein